MSSLACDMNAIPPEERAEHGRVTRVLVAAATEIIVDQDAMLLRVPASEYETAVRFISRERHCCPFLTFTLDVPEERGTITLRLAGPPGTAEFLKAELL